MAEQAAKTLTCPACGNVNLWAQDACIRCGLALGPIREAMGRAGTSQPQPPQAAEAPASPVEPREPAPPLPELPPRPTDQPTAKFVDRESFLVRGMGDRAEEIAARFFKQPPRAESMA